MPSPSIDLREQDKHPFKRNYQESFPLAAGGSNQGKPKVQTNFSVRIHRLQPKEQQLGLLILFEEVSAEEVFYRL